MGRLKRNNKAFTIVEALLFLAISGGMLLIALNAISGRNDEVRFQQSMRAVEALVQLQQNYVQNGVVADTPACVDCVLLGRAIEFAPNTEEIIIHTITGDRLDAFGDDAITLADASPRPTDISVETNRLEWQTEFLDGEFYAGTASAVSSDENRVIAYVRLPNGTEIVPIGFNVPPGEASLVLSEPCLYDASLALCGSYSIANSTVREAFSAELCFVSPDENRYARLILGGQERRQAVKVEFDGVASCA